ncbi:MAG: ABC transporter permease [Phyllobacteriaceae bacterium]|nr:ABC transporter permease [Phyllobacteriaceae bacterium]
MKPSRSLPDFALQNATYLIFAAILLYFASQAPSFILPESLGNILKQGSFIGIAAVGMTFVLLTAGIDLSVGSVIYLAPLIAGLVMQQLGLPPIAGLFVALAVGVVLGGINAFLIVRLHIVPFIVTLATLFFFRGFGVWLTDSVPFNFEPAFLAFGRQHIFGVPAPVLMLIVVCVLAQLVLSHSSFGRQVYAVGNSPESARKAGLNVDWIKARCYMISSACAALAGYMWIAQIGRLDAGFGEGKEFDVIAAAVLGGVSLFGGVGSAVGSVVGAMLIQTVSAGLSFTGVNLYAQPIVQGTIIFAAVFVDGIRGKRQQARLKRTIRPL